MWPFESTEELLLATPGSSAKPLANSQIRLDGLKEITSQIHKSPQLIAETKYFRVAAREHTLAAPGTHRPTATFADESYGLPKYTSD